MFDGLDGLLEFSSCKQIYLISCLLGLVFVFL